LGLGEFVSLGHFVDRANLGDRGDVMEAGNMKSSSLGKTFWLGSAAGLAGTVLMKSMMVASEKLAPQVLPPVSEDPGEFMVKQVEGALPEKTREKIPEKLESVAATALGFGYGTTLAGIYAFLRRGRTNVIFDGAALGGLTWAIGYLGWIPAAKLAPPIHRQEPQQIASNMISHILFGIASMAAFDFLRRKI
jgi:hypothetical protein